MRNFVLGLALTAAIAPPAAAHTTCLPSSECEELEPAERQDLVMRLREVQQALRTGEWVPFTLMLGAMASNEMIDVTPRQAFLKIDFAKAATAKRLRTKNKHYLLTYYDGSDSADRMGRVALYWDIEVVIGFRGKIERVSMLYRPPDPF